MSKRITISMDDELYTTIRVKHTNISKYIHGLVMQDVWAEEMPQLYDDFVAQLKRDGYITDHITFSAPHPTSGINPWWPQ